MWKQFHLCTITKGYAWKESAVFISLCFSFFFDLSKSYIWERKGKQRVMNVIHEWLWKNPCLAYMNVIHELLWKESMLGIHVCHTWRWIGIIQSNFIWPNQKLNLNQGPIHAVIELPHSLAFHHNQLLLGLKLFLLSPRSGWLCQRWKYLFSDGGMMEGWGMWMLNDCKPDLWTYQEVWTGARRRLALGQSNLSFVICLFLFCPIFIF